MRGTRLGTGSSSPEPRHPRAATIAVLLTLVACGRTKPGPTLPWFHTETTGPLVIAPHVLEIGSSKLRAYQRVGGRWVKVYGGPVAAVLVLDRGRAVVLEGPRQLFREDVRTAIPLDPGACPEDAAVAATDEGGRIVCVVVRTGYEPLVAVAQLDASGRIVRADRAPRNAGRPWSAATDADNTWEILGFTREWDPVLALRSAERSSRYDVHVLRAGGSEVVDELAFELEKGGRIHGQNLDRVTARLGPLVGVFWSSWGFRAPAADSP